MTDKFWSINLHFLNFSQRIPTTCIPRNWRFHTRAQMLLTSLSQTTPLLKVIPKFLMYRLLTHDFLFPESNHKDEKYSRWNAYSESHWKITLMGFIKEGQDRGSTMLIKIILIITAAISKGNRAEGFYLGRIKNIILAESISALLPST